MCILTAEAIRVEVESGIICEFNKTTDIHQKLPKRAVKTETEPETKPQTEKETEVETESEAETKIVLVEEYSPDTSDTENSFEIFENKNEPKKRKRRRRRRRKKKGQTNVTEEAKLISDCSSSDISESDVASSDFSTASPLHLSNRANETTKKVLKKPRERTRKKSSGQKIIPWDATSDEVISQYVGLDCEMVGIGVNGYHSALARVSIVDWYGRPIFDSFVRVHETVTDYRTHVSGITRHDIESEETLSFEECRETVLEMIKGKVLVGHGLKNDLKVLKIHHPWYDIRDTARYEPLMRSDPTSPGNFIPRKLKELAMICADMTIQCEGEQHCPIEDATAAMIVFRTKRVKWEKSIEWKVQKTNSMMNNISDSNSD
uniref:RNA exonuclease 4 n=1 Tax=Corethron hystrix TaxID=216773 RepID=A0A7S1G1A7_9STRA|mmetsp:Transcript_5759/g.12188  ORF Transcript_5759/g.12188 Transcript_5759/m.12188 type:complete len:376 (+) Transcript_5759:245-1372(+)